MINTVIIDDEPIAIEILSDFIKEFDDLELTGAFRDPVEALNSKALSKADLIFLDIQMPKMSGIELLKSTHVRPMIIFTTAFSDYALESFEFLTIDYLVKPIAFSRFAKAIQKVRLVAVENKTIGDRLFIFKDGKQTFRIPFSKILYIQSEGDYVHVYTELKRYLTYNRISKLEQELVEFGFERCHQSYLVNMEKVELLESASLNLGNTRIPISRSYKDRIRKRFGSPQ